MRQEFLFTHHAVERYIQRHARHLSFQEAMTALEEGALEAEVLPQKTLAGQTQWLLKNPRVVLVTKSEQKRCIVVTVLPREATPEESEWMEEDEWAAQPPPEPLPFGPAAPEVTFAATPELSERSPSSLLQQIKGLQRKLRAQHEHAIALEKQNMRYKNVLRLTIIALLDCVAQSELAAMVIAKIESENATLLSDKFLGRR